jgi:hypothetical protein
MASPLELRSRALLCRQLAIQEPANRVFWLAEAESWSRLSNRDASRRDNRKIDSIVWRICRPGAGKFSSISVWRGLRKKRPDVAA